MWSVVTGTLGRLNFSVLSFLEMGGCIKNCEITVVEHNCLVEIYCQTCCSYDKANYGTDNMHTRKHNPYAGSVGIKMLTYCIVFLKVVTMESIHHTAINISESISN